MRDTKPIIKVRTIGYNLEELTPQDTYLLKDLMNKYEFVHDIAMPDLVIVYSCTRTQSYKNFVYLHKTYGFRPFIVNVTGEVHIVEKRNADYTFSYQADSDSNSFLAPFTNSPFNDPYFDCMLSEKPNERMRALKQTSKDRFCAFIYSHTKWRLPATIVREKFCQQLMQYKHVDCAGKILNNTNELQLIDGEDKSYTGKLEFISKYKFLIVFENRIRPNYVTEKICDALVTGSIPIYRGCPEIAKFFNPEAFINCADYASFEEVIARVKQVDNDPALYEKYISAPPILADSLLHNNSEANLAIKMDMVIKKVLAKKNTYAQKNLPAQYNAMKMFLWRVKNLDREILAFLGMLLGLLRKLLRR